jgi:hypothetical protein
LANQARTQGVVSSFSGRILSGNAAEFFVNKRQEFIGRLSVAVLAPAQYVGELAQFCSWSAGTR